MVHETPTAKKIIDKLGRASMMARLNVSKQTLSDAYRADRMPASWFDIVDAMCREAGIICPRSAFHFRAGATDADAA